MRLLITGGGGYLGTVLVRHLLRSSGHTLTILDRFTWGAQPLLSVLQPEDHARVSVVVGDVADGEAVDNGWAQADAAIHLAGIVGYPACAVDPTEAFRTNVIGTMTLCAAARGRKVVHASTGSVYGAVDGLCTEGSPCRTTTVYGQTKLQAEGVIDDSGGVNLRFATLFGLSPRMRWDLLPHDFARQLQTTGTLALYSKGARRTFLHVQGAARALTAAVSWPSGIYNVGDERANLTKQEVAQLLQGLIGRPTTLQVGEGHDPDQRDYAVSYQKVQTETTWRAHLALADALPQVLLAARLWRDQ